MTPPNPPSKPWRVCGPRGMSLDYHGQRAAYEAVEGITSGPGAAQAVVWHWQDGSWELYEHVEPVPIHPEEETGR